MPKKIHVIINPASGKPQPILHPVNQVFHAAGVSWDVSLTHASGDAYKAAKAAAAAGVDVVAAFGGDGTVMEVARGLSGSSTPLAILPGGTANLMSVELGIPKDLTQAAQIACDPQSRVREVDMGQIGEDFFLLRVGIGFGARKVEYADRQLKSKYGIMAYTLAGIKALTAKNKAMYRLTIDGEKMEIEGISCVVDNAGNMGVPGSSPVPNIRVDDGLLDVIVLKPESYMGVNTKMLMSNRPFRDVLNHWQGREIHIETVPPQPVQVDGEISEPTPIDVRVIPQAVRILTR